MERKHNYTKDLFENLLNQGLSQKKIASILEISTATVNYWLKKFDILNIQNGKRITNKKIFMEKQIIKLHDQGKTVVEISEEIKIDRRRIYECLSKYDKVPNNNISNTYIGDDKAECKKCKKVKLLSEFYKTGTSYSGLCKSCFNYDRKLKRYGTLEKYFDYKIESLKSKCNLKNISFNINKEYLIELYYNQNGKCFYSNRRLEYLPVKENNRESVKNRLSVDRINPEKGYIKGNIVLCTHITNSIKLDLNLDEIKEFLPRWYKKIKEKINEL